MIYNYDSTMPGMPAFSGTAGALASVLKTCLVTGGAVLSVTSATVAAGVATASYASAHGLKVGTVLQVAGATPAGLNGLKPITAVTSNTLKFAAVGVADGAATGSITSKIAPATWQELFSGTLSNVIALKPTAVEAAGCVLRVDDTGTINARVRGYESMGDITTGTGLIPLDSQVSGGLFWPKSGAAGAAARPWYLVADERGFYFAVDPQGTGRWTLLYAGDIESLKSGDAYGWLLAGNQSDQTAATTVPDGCCGWSHRSARNGAYLARLHTAVGQAVAAQRIGSHHTGTLADGYAGTAGYAWGTYPNGPNNGLLTGSLELFALGVRGALPGLLHPVQDCGAAFASGALVDGTDDMAGRRLLALRVAPPSGAVTAGTVLLDLTGPWRR